MLKKYFELIILLLVVTFVSYAKVIEQSDDKPYVILVSFDGFRHDYVQKFNAPNFQSFIKEGAASESLIPSFPSKTFPNHYSIVTGLYPGNHGLVDNSFYDRNLDLSYSIGNRKVVEDAQFYGGTPLWQLVQANNLKSASYFWVGSEAPIKGSYPDYYHIYDGAIPNETRIEAAMDWLEMPAEQRPQFISLYFSLVDDAGHRYGPNAPETNEAVLEADRLLGLLMEGIAKRSLDINVILVSDHGMNEITPEKENYITYDELQEGLDRPAYNFVSNGAHAHFYVKDPAQTQTIYEHLKSREDHFTTYLRKEFPKHWHYNNEVRTGDIIITLDKGHYLSSQARVDSYVKDKIIRGEHGFDPLNTKDMHGIFYAKGPQIKEGAEIGSFDNVHIYPFVARLLGITEWPAIDGDLNVLKSIIKD